MNRLAATWMLACGMGAAGCASRSVADLRTAGCTPDVPEYSCRFATQAPVIDGKLDDPAWRQAAPINLRLAEDGGTPRQPTIVRALWDEKYLYLAYDCTDNDIWAGFTKHDSHIYDQEVVEVFLNENLDGHSYAEFEVSPNNTTLDVYILNPADGRKFKILFDYECDGLKTAVDVAGTVGDAPAKSSKDDRGWTVEMAVPFDQLMLMPHHPPQVGDRMRWNVFRIDRPGEGDDRDEFSTLSPTGQGTFHKPRRFGWLIFNQ